MNRKQFIESHGGTCKNWTWSWSFINKAEKTIFFGAWDMHTDGQKALILSEEWKANPRGKKSAAYDQSREHVRLIEEEGYRLKTFTLKYSDAKKGKDGLGPAKIDGFIPELTEKTLSKVGNSWYASSGAATNSLPEEITHPEKYAEGAKKTVTINAYERSPKARAACIAHHGVTCMTCGFNFEQAYGTLGEGFIHVHHIIPIGKIAVEYEVNPVTDLVPVCPNCHAMIHRAEPPLTIQQLREHLEGKNAKKDSAA
ncbi:MAG: HNH endonuclease [Verrucomicrobia bacterium]|nr:HNH endonuclease [Verrucomicrobiota bacterium]